MTKPRARDLGLDFPGIPGPHNAITDIPGVLVGYTTLIDDAAHIRTGVTAILPHGHDPVPRPVWAGQFSLNGNGEMTGTHWIHDAGYFTGPVCITNTHSVGMVHHAATRWMIDRYGKAFGDDYVWAMPVVAETYDGVLNDINGQHVHAEHALAAIEGATGGIPAEGNVGGGTGMVCYEFKGGTGTSSRQVTLAGEDYTVGALVQANHGIREWLTILGVPLGRYMKEDLLKPKETGSIIVVIGTDAPLSPLSLQHLAKRASIGIGRHGTPSGNSSGDIFLAFSTANKRELPQLSAAKQSFEFINNELMDPCYLAAVETVEEAVVNALVAADAMTTVKPAGLICRAIDHNALRDAMRRHGRLKE
ncbi:MAG: P1 family peptidase [Alphaproteobacteria bacterium]|nr:P1 family peptidase [Alphaproteobacteria bacterium]